MGALKGAAGNKTKTTTNATSTSNPYAPTIPYLDEILGKAQTLYNANPNPTYGPSAVPNASGTTTAAQNSIIASSNAPTGLIPQAQGTLGQTIGGSMLNSGPGNAALSNVASGGAINPATSVAAGMQGGYADPSQGFNNALMTYGFQNSATPLYGQMAGMQARDNTSGLYSQAANAQAGQGGTALYNQLGGMTGNTDALGMYANLGGMRADTGGMQDYANIGGMRANADPNAMGVYNNMAQGNFDQGANTYEQLANRQYTDPSSAAMADYLKPFANGSLSDVNSNPYLQGMLDIQARRIGDSVNSMFGAGNRYGSGANQDLLGRSVGDAATQMLGTAYDANMNRQLSAAGQYANIGENRAGRDLAAMQAGAAGMEGQRLANLNANMQGANALSQQAQFADQFGAQNALAGAAGQQGIRQFADQYAAQNAQAGAAGTAGVNQFLDQYRAGNIGQAAAGIQNQSQFGDQFNQQALLSGAAGLQSNQQFGDQFGLEALGQGAAGLNNAALSQIQAQGTAANNLSSSLNNQYGAALNAVGTYGQLGQSNTANIMSAAGGLNDQFAKERENQLNATNNAPALDQARYLDAQQALQVGMQKDALAQAQALEAQKAYQYNNNQAPYAALDQYLSTVGNIAGLGGTRTMQGTEVTKQGGGLLSGIAGGIGGFMGSMGGMASGIGSGNMGGMSSGFGGGAMSGFAMPSMGYNPFSLMNYGTNPYGGNKFSLA